jgi:hypothetical protein
MRMPAPPAERNAVTRPVPGPEPVRWILGGHPALDRHATRFDLVLLEPELREGRSAGDEQLRLHQVNVADLFGDGVLDLDPRVHLDEVVLAVGVEQELDRTGVDVADLLGEPDRVRADRIAHLRVQSGRRSDLQHLLVSPLHRTVALVQVHHLTRRVGKHLHLDVAGPQDRLLQEDRLVTEASRSLVAGAGDRLGKLARLGHQPQSTSAAPTRCLDEDRKADPFRLGRQIRILRQRIARCQNRQTGGDRLRLRRDLVTGDLQHLSRRAYEHHSRPPTRPRQRR